MKQLYIFRGLPGSGKSTHAHRVASLVVEPDMFRYNASMQYKFNADKNSEVFDKATDLLVYAMRHLRMPAIALTATFTKVERLRRFIKLGKKYGYSVIVVECYGDYGNIHNVPEDVIDRMRKEFEPITDEILDGLGVDRMRLYQKGSDK